jgi:pyruvate kinase
MGFAAHNQPPTGACKELIRQMESLRLEIEQQASQKRPGFLNLAKERHPSAENLMHYLALRSRDLRQLQDRLARLGLSSLGRTEPHVLASINMIIHNLYLLSGQEPPTDTNTDLQTAFDLGADLLEKNTRILLGQDPEKRRGHIMVTMPAEAANDYMMVHQLLKTGMNCARINCSKDDSSVWKRIVAHLHNAQRATGQPCRILLDLGGPKLRTGPMEPVPGILKIRPIRAGNGSVIRPARIWLAPNKAQTREVEAADANLVLDPDWLAEISIGDRIRFRDARDARRTWRIRKVTHGGCWAETRKTCYLANGTMLYLQRKGNVPNTEVAGLMPRAGEIQIQTGDVLLISGSDEPGIPAIRDETGKLLNPGRISLAISEVYRDARPGEPVCFDDGRITGIIEKRKFDQLQIRITNTHKQVEKLSGDRGINFPDTRLDLPALSDKDLQDLEFAARYADMIGLSFVNSAQDVGSLRQHLHELGADHLGVVVKIETKRGFNNLPAILLETLQFPACGVMIARGDLAVECGFERMAELQEEILWICESAHVPVIWATQVLEGLTRRGHASRAEITDAAMSQAAEAVMLNKGPHIIDAVKTLDDILQRMQGHHSKKQSMLRKLQLAAGKFGSE